MLFEEWVSGYKQMDSDMNTDYFPIRNTSGNGRSSRGDILNNRSKYLFGALTYHSRLSILRLLATR